MTTRQGTRPKTGSPTGKVTSPLVEAANLTRVGPPPSLPLLPSDLCEQTVPMNLYEHMIFDLQPVTARRIDPSNSRTARLLVACLLHALCAVMERGAGLGRGALPLLMTAALLLPASRGYLLGGGIASSRRVARPPSWTGRTEVTMAAATTSKDHDIGAMKVRILLLQLKDTAGEGRVGYSGND